MTTKTESDLLAAAIAFRAAERACLVAETSEAMEAADAAIEEARRRLDEAIADAERQR